MWPQTPAVALWHAHVGQSQDSGCNMWPHMTGGAGWHTTHFQNPSSSSNMCPQTLGHALWPQTNQHNPCQTWTPQRLPPTIPDNRFLQDRTQRVYVCDHCQARVPWLGQSQAFDGQYWAYDNKSPNHVLQEQWERGRDFRWFCTACYARWWNVNDLVEVRRRLGLLEKVKARVRLAQEWREKGGANRQGPP